MRLQELILENYRGYNTELPIPLDGRVLLFYGQNGRGKSSVFGALEMALFPAEKIGELRRDFGTHAPLTNRFNASQIGTIRLRMAGEQPETVVQVVRDQLDEMEPASLPIHREIAGHRRRIFFTQDLLRDLMLGSSTIRYRRLSEMLGCDAYDRLVVELARWAYRRGVQIREQADMLERLDDHMKRISAFLREQGMDPVLSELRKRRFTPDLAQWFTEAVIRSWQERDADLHSFLVDRVEMGRPTTLLECHRRLMQTEATLKRLLGPFPTRKVAVDALPVTWYHALSKALDKLAAARDRLRRLRAHMEGAQSDSGAQPDHLLRKAELDIEMAEGEWNLLVEGLRKRAEVLLNQTAASGYVLSRLDVMQHLLRRMGKQMPRSVKQAKRLVQHRRSVLHGVRGLYDALIQLAHAELQRRAELLRPLWKEYYGQITSHAHFQDVDIDARQENPDEDAMSALWSLPRQTVRFLVSDPEDKKKAGDTLPMQALLSEGQLNCAVVGLALALSEVKPPPLKVIALDDPFVSWDDVNMENFLAAVRGLAWKGWTVILSTCDARVVSSFRKNMETLGEDLPSIIYTFRSWEKERGPRVVFDRVPKRQSRHLRDLTPDLFEREVL